MVKHRKLTAWIIALATVLTCLPIMPASVAAADDEIYYEYTFRAASASSDGITSGTPSPYAVFYFYNTTLGKNGDSVRGTITGDGIKKRGEWTSVTSGKVTYEPWNLSKVVIKNETNAWKCSCMADLKVTIYKNNKTIASYTYNVEDPQLSLLPTSYFIGQNGSGSLGAWVSAQNFNYTVGGINYVTFKELTFNINFGGKGEQTFNPKTITDWADFTDTIYLDVDETLSDTVTKQLSGKYTGSRYGTNLNMWEHSGIAPKMEFKVISESETNTSPTWTTLKSNGITELYTNGYTSGYTINKQALVSYMNKNDINRLTIDTYISFNWWAFSDENYSKSKFGEMIGGDVFKRSCTIVRKALEIDDITILSAIPSSVTASDKQTLTYYPIAKEGLFLHYLNGKDPNAEGNYYINSDATMIAVSIKFKNTNSYSHITYDFYSKNYVSSVPTLILDDGTTTTELEMRNFPHKKLELTNEQLARLKVQPDGSGKGKLTLYYYVKGEQLDTLGNGMTVSFDNFDVGGFKLTNPGVDYTKSGTAGTMTRYISNYKVDTIKPYIDAEITNNDAGDEANGWRKTAVVQYQPNEDLNSTMDTLTGDNSSVDGKMTYAFITEDGQMPEITDLIGRNTLNGQSVAKAIQGASASSSSPSTITVELADSNKMEAVGALCVYTARDTAGNTPASGPASDGEYMTYNKAQYAKIIDLKLDNLAPRVKIDGDVGTADASSNKNAIFNFNVDDASGSAKVYYVFSESETAPDFDTDAQKTSGTIDTTLDMWAYVEQTEDLAYPDDADSTYNTTNGAAAMTIASGKAFTGYIHYFAEDGIGNKTETSTVKFIVDNSNVDCDITVKEIGSKPLSNYTIDVATSSSNTVYYRWAYPGTAGNTYVSSYKLYTGAEDIGSGIQYTDDNTAVTLDGECTLYVKVVNGTASQEYTKVVNFDNSEPKIRLTNANSRSYLSAHTIGVSATDESGIISASAQIIDAYGNVYVPTVDSDEDTDTEEATAETVEETTASVMSLSADENGAVSTDITISDVEAGVYTLRVTAKDFNGYETTTESNPFYIRNDAPETEITIETENTYSDHPLLSNGSYTMTIDASEAFTGASADQYLYYRFSYDNRTWSAWTNGGKMTAADDSHKLTLALDTPCALSEGENIVYVQTAVSSSASTAPSASIASDSIIAVVDTTAPMYRLNITDRHTNEPIIGSLTLSDAYSTEFTIVSNSSLVTVEKTEDITSDDETTEDMESTETTEETESTETTEETESTEEETDTSDGIDKGFYTVTVNGNVDTTITVTDAAGNITEIPVKIEGFDFNGPEIEIASPVTSTSGTRTDTAVEVAMSNLLEGTERFAFIPADDYDAAFDENGNILEEYFTNSNEYAILSLEGDFSPYVTTMTSQTLAEYSDDCCLGYTVSMHGITGTYYLGVYCEDSLGNASELVSNEPITVSCEDIAMVGDISVSPEKANTKARIYASFNMPVYILPQSSIKTTADEDMTLEETNLSSARTSASTYSENQTFLIESTGTYTFYVVDEIGRGAVFEVEVTDDMVSFGNADVIDAETVVIGGEMTGIGSSDITPDVQWTIADNELVMPGAGYNKEGYDYRFFTAVEVTAPDGYALMPIDEDLSWDNGNGLLFWDYVSEPYMVDPNDASAGYTKLYYMTSTITYEMNERDYAVETLERATSVKYKTDADDTWLEYDIIVNNIDNTPPHIDGTVLPDTVRDADGNPTLFTPGDVTIDMTVSDAQSGLDSIYITVIPYESDDYISLEFSLAQVDPSLVLYDSDLMTITVEGYYDENGVDLEPMGVKHILLTAHENAMVMLEASNLLGDGGMYMSSATGEGDVVIDYINRVDISESDFTVEYYYEDYSGAWQPIEDGTYYKKAKTVLTPSDSGIERGLTIYNNGTSGEKIYTEYDNTFTYLLRDQYGYEYSYAVVLENFDNTPGTISYSLSSTAKTNQPIDITITASDDESGVASVILQRKIGTESEDIALTANSDGTYTGSIDKAGSYVITMYDNVGNMAQKSLVVSNIDTEVPTVTAVTWNIADGEKTSGSVVAALTYSKPNVTITDVSDASGSFSAGDYVVNKTNSILRFYENGSLNVWFEDEYGNEGVSLVTADQIYNEPPALTAVMTVADDTLSVDISFEKALKDDGTPVDPYRLLTDIMVNYDGIVKYAEETEYDEDGTIIGTYPSVFTFTENGTYTFDVYDAEGLTSHITIEITGIDRTAPVIQQVRWSYDYDVLENGEWVSKQAAGERTVEDEAGYVLATDEYNITNQDVTVTVTTDSDTTVVGYSGSESASEHSLNYFENGMYIFNLQKNNGLFDSYAFDVEIIDKTPPVITLASPEIVFYENEAANEIPYDKSMILSPGVAFTASDTFAGVTTDLSDRVVIDLGDFDAEDITQNKFDRSSPYTITYTVYDDAHNRFEAQMTVRLVGENDSVALINGSFPDYAGRKELREQENIIITLGNFSGVSYARVMPGMWTMGEMKKRGTLLSETSSGSGEYIYIPSENGWYTFLVQTDKRDYFTLQVYFYK